MRKGGSVAHRRDTTREARSIRNSVTQAEFGCPGEDQARFNLTTNSALANVFGYGCGATLQELYFIITIFFVATNDPAVSR